ncbi:MAG: hypothetical protein BGO01_12300 [Armatimonadetes bacterium 55-13]|nr:hypothetical protein [Armatimonadota bacterium]OJU61695.1 MAG: hypothetical protein BGO01_12300 [Armatimonadetes bacterium 55-13]
MTSLILAGLLLQPKLTLNERSIRLGTLLEEIGKLSGERLECAPALAQEPIAIRINGVALDQLRDKLAQVMAASWVQRNGTKILERPPKDQQEAVKVDQQATALRYQEAIENQKRIEVEQKSTYDEARNAISRFQKMSAGELRPDLRGHIDLQLPVDLLLRRIAIRLGPEGIAQLPNYRITAFSDDPNKMERSFPASCQADLKAYQVAQKSLMDLVDTKWKSPDPDYQAWWDDLVSRVQNREPHAKFVLSALPRPTATYLLLTEYSSSGARREVATLNLPASPSVYPVTFILPFNKVPVNPAHLGLISMFSGGSPVQTPKFRTPDTNEPMAEAPYDTLNGMPASQNLLARLPDEAVVAAAQSAEQGNFDTQKFWTAMQRDQGARISRDDQWLTVQPRNTLAWERSRLNRPALQKLLNNPIELRALCKFNAACPEGAPEGALFKAYVQAMPKDGLEAPAIELSTPQLCFLGDLTDGDWLRLIKGQTVNVGGLAPVQRDRFFTWACMGVSNMFDYIGGGMLFPADPNEKLSDQALYGPEALRDGINQDVILRLDISKTYALKEQQDTWKSIVIPFPRILEMVQNSRQNPDDPIANILPGKYRLAEQPTYRFLAQLRPGVLLRRVVGDQPVLLPPSTPVPFTQLPKEFLDEVKKALTAGG